MRKRRSRFVSWSTLAPLAWVLVLVSGAPAAAQSGIRAKVTYAGSLGPVSGNKPLCLCLFYDANLTNEAGCLISGSNGRTFSINTGDTEDYYVVAFLDLERNEVVDANEPFEIFADRGAPPADPVTAMEGYNDIEIEFGDEHLPPPCLGDCDQSGEVTPDEVTALVVADLDGSQVASCTAGDGDDSSSITVDEIVNAVSHLGLACPL